MKKLTLFSFLLYFSTTSAFAVATPWQSNAHGEVRLISPYVVAPWQGTIYFGLEFKTQKGWHVYWKNAGDAGYAPRLKWEGSKGFNQPELLFPPPHYYTLPGDLIAIGYSGDVVYPIRAQLNGDGGKLHAVVDVDYLTCGDSCVPYKYKFTLDLPTGASPQLDPETNPLIASAVENLPISPEQRSDRTITSALYRQGDDFYFEVKLPATLHAIAKHMELFLESHPDLAFRRSQATTLKDGDVVVRLPGQLKDTKHLHGQTKLSYVLTGLESDTGAHAVEHTDLYWPRKLRAENVPPVVPPAPNVEILSLAWAILLGLLGGLILNVMPCVLPVLSIKLFGLIQHSGEKRHVIIRDALASAAGIVTSFIIGGGIAVLARRTGMAVGWGTQFQDPRFIAFLAIIVTLFALNLWGVFEINLSPALTHFGASSSREEGAVSFFVSGMFATLLATPCSAPFLGTAMGFGLSQPAVTTLVIFGSAGIGMALPYLLLAAVPQTLHWLPRPGAWMLYVKYVMGLFLAATVLWLGWVLSAQVDHTGMMLFYLGLMIVGLLAWAKRILGQRQQSQWAVWVGLLLLIIGMVKGIPNHRQTPVSSPAAQEGPLHWETFDQLKLAKYLKAGKRVFVDVTADWCFTCKYNEKVVLNSRTVVQAFEMQKIVLMKADWTNRDTMIGDYLKSFNRYGIPFYAYYQPRKDPVVLSEFLTEKQILQALGK